VFNFDLKKTKIHQALRWEPVFRLIGFFGRAFKIVFIVVFLFFIIAFLFELFSSEFFSVLLGFSIISLVIFVACSWNRAFFDLKLKRPKLSGKEGSNLAEFLSFEAAKAVSKSIKFAKTKKISEINSFILFYFILEDNPKLNFIFSRAILDIKEIKKTFKREIYLSKREARGERVSSNLFSEDFQKTILESLKIANKNDRQKIEIGDMLICLAFHNPVFKRFLIKAKLNIRDIENLVWWLESLEKKIAERKKWWEYKNLLKKGSLAKEWTTGYTITLDKYSFDWRDTIKQMGFEEIIGHQNEIKMVERILSRSKLNNVLLVGQPGVGRGSIIQALTMKSFFGKSLAPINYKRVVELDLSSLISNIEDPGETEIILGKIFQEAVLAGNVILVINEFHNFVGGAARPGVIDISGLIAPFLKLPQFQIVAVTSYIGLHKYIEKNPSMLSLFEKVEVSEISRLETIKLLENLALRLEAKYKLLFTYPAIRDVFSFSKRYMPATPFPKKAMDLLDEAAVYVVHSTKDKMLLPKHIAKIITQKTEIPVGEMEKKEKEILLNLENLIHQRLINQNEAVKEISAALRRARAGVSKRKGPMGCFLFLGPTGVGKTETAKALSEIYFKTESRMIRLDMSEFQAVKDISRLIGSSETEGLLTTNVRETPFSLVLLDEVEKAHPNILNLFLQVLDEGRLTDGLGRKVDFSNTIIIATSNAGYKIILEVLKEKSEWSSVKQKLLDYLFKKAIFRPEFINRFDAMVVFRPLSKENLLDIAELMFQRLKKHLKEKGVDFIITQPLKQKIVELGYNPVFGARNLKRVIQDKVENVLAQALLSGELKRGDKVEIDPQEFRLKKI
jgi:ATP-dependent Clp protease ATP-binding subunit ClpC